MSCLDFFHFRVERPSDRIELSSIAPPLVGFRFRGVSSSPVELVMGADPVVEA